MGENTGGNVDETEGEKKEEEGGKGSLNGNCQVRGSPLPRNLAIATVLDDTGSIDQNKIKVKSKCLLVHYRRIPHV